MPASSSASATGGRRPGENLARAPKDDKSQPAATAFRGAVINPLSRSNESKRAVRSVDQPQKVKKMKALLGRRKMKAAKVVETVDVKAVQEVDAYQGGETKHHKDEEGPLSHSAQVSAALQHGLEKAGRSPVKSDSNTKKSRSASPKVTETPNFPSPVKSPFSPAAVQARLAAQMDMNIQHHLAEIEKEEEERLKNEEPECRKGKRRSSASDIEKQVAENATCHAAAEACRQSGVDETKDEQKQIEAQKQKMNADLATTKTKASSAPFGTEPRATKVTTKVTTQTMKNPEKREMTPTTKFSSPTSESNNLSVSSPFGDVPKTPSPASEFNDLSASSPFGDVPKTESPAPEFNNLSVSSPFGDVPVTPAAAEATSTAQSADLHQIEKEETADEAPSTTAYSSTWDIDSPKSSTTITSLKSSIGLPTIETRHKAVERLHVLGDLFVEADTCGDGFLSHDELAGLLLRYHKEVEKVSRPLKRIQSDVAAVMNEYDVTGTGR